MTDLFMLTKIEEEQPSIGPCVVFVEGMGFTQAVRLASGYQSTITKQKVEPTHWLKPIPLEEAIELGWKEIEKAGFDKPFTGLDDNTIGKIVMESDSATVTFMLTPEEFEARYGHLNRNDKHNGTI